MEKVFVGFESPPLDAFVNEIIAIAQDQKDVELGDVTVLLPTKRSTRLFLERLLQICIDKQRVLVTPPTILTPGAFINRSLDAGDSTASDCARLLVWKQVLASSAEKLKPLLRAAPIPETFAEWMGLAGQLDQLRAELLGNCLTFESVRAQLAEEGFDRESERWECLAFFEDAYQHALNELGLKDLYRDRLENVTAVRVSGSALYVAGCVELPEILRQALTHVDKPVTILIVADSADESAFDEFGCIKAESYGWFDIKAITDAAIVVDSFDEQALLVSCIVDDVSKTGLQQDDIFLACCDEESWGVLQQQLSEHGIASRPAAGRPLKETPLFLLFSLIASYCSEPLFSSFASMIRHPDIERYVCSLIQEKPGGKQFDIPTVVDAYHARHLPAKVSSSPLVGSRSDEQFAAVVQTVNELTSVFKAGDRTAAEWNDILANFLVKVLPDSLGPQQLELKDSCLELAILLDQLRATPLTMSGTEFLQLLGIGAVNIRLPQLPDVDSLDLFGWLEVQLNSSKIVIVTDAVEGCLPTAVTADLFLPDTLREKLQLPCNARRFARDAYLLHVLSRTSDRMFFTVSRKRSNGDYAIPSRFLCSSDDHIEKVRDIVAGQPVRFEFPPHGAVDESGVCTLTEPELAGIEISSVSVTSLKTYLTCPYQFYLLHVLRIEQLNDQARELDALQFGNLIHDVLERFAKTDVVQSADRKAVSECLNDILDSQVRGLFGVHVEPAVLVQIEQVRVRLSFVADVHCARVREGWRVLESEWKFGEMVFLSIGGKDIQLRGRIDRVERHEKSNRIAILDYKTGETVYHPDKVHRKRVLGSKPAIYEWTDLQLPAYWYALRAHGYIEDVELGYFNVGSKTEHIGVDTVGWTDAEVQDGISVLKETVASIVARTFWPPKKIPPSSSAVHRLFHGLTVDQFVR